MSHTQNESSALDDSLATIIVVTTSRNELSCDNPFLRDECMEKEKTHTHTHSCVSGGNPLETMFGMLRDLRRDAGVI